MQMSSYRALATAFLKLLKRLTVGQAGPEIPLSVGSKLEQLLRAFYIILPRTLTHLSAYAYCGAEGFALQCMQHQVTARYHAV